MKYNRENNVEPNDLMLYNYFLSLDNKAKQLYFNDLKSEQIYGLFKVQECKRESMLKNYDNLAKHYNLINEKNANKYLTIREDYICINWPDNYGYKIETVKKLEDLNEEEILVSRVVYKNEDNINLNKIYKSILYKESYFKKEEIGNCFSYSKKLEKSSKKCFDINIIFKQEKLTPNIDTDLFKRILGYWPSTEERAIPKNKDGSILYCGVFYLKKYFEFIKILNSKLNESEKKCRLKALKISTIDELLKHCKEQFENYRKMNNCLNDLETDYGYFGIINCFGSLQGGAYQINTIFDYMLLRALGLIKDFKFIYINDDNMHIANFSFKEI